MAKPTRHTLAISMSSNVSSSSEPHAIPATSSASDGGRTRKDVIARLHKLQSSALVDPAGVKDKSKIIAELNDICSFLQTENTQLHVKVRMLPQGQLPCERTSCTVSRFACRAPRPPPHGCLFSLASGAPTAVITHATTARRRPHAPFPAFCSSMAPRRGLMRARRRSACS